MNNLQLNQLSREQVEQIRNLELACQQKDGLKGTVFLSNEINFSAEIDSFYLLYDGNTLVSFLSMFIPTRDVSEISAYTLPEYRRRGYFHLLFQKAAAELKKHGLNKILFVHEPQSDDAKSVLEHYHSEYDFTEYLLIYDSSSFQRCESRIQLVPAVQKDIPEIASLTSSVFEDDYEEALSITTKSIASPDIHQYCAFLGDKMIGICNANLEGGDISIFGVVISPEFQDKGYGREMLNLLLDELIHHESGEITIEVNSKNAAAYHLYLTSGFKLKAQFDYDSYTLKN